jgi:hypothetical protein
MAQQQQKQKQPQDPYAQQVKKLASAVQRLRGWVGSDPSRNAELGDALVALTGHRLLGHAYADAATEAQEAVVLAGKLLAEQGPIGPYTPVPDAVRYFTAAVHLAAIQAGVGLPDASARTMQAALDWQQQLRRHLSLDDQLSPTAAVWALSVQAQAALTAGEVERANAYVDAALDRLVEGGLTEVADSYLPMDIERLVADARWAAGHLDEALTHDELAREQFERVVGGRLANPGRLSPALLTRLAEPLFGLHRVISDRLVAAGEVDRGLVMRRSLIETLSGLTRRLGEAATAQHAQSLDDLAADLLLAGRVEEAQLVAEEARQTAARLTGELVGDVRVTLGSSADRADRRPGREQPLASWPALDDVQSFAGSTAGARSARPTAEVEAEMLRQAQARAEAERAAAHRLEEERQARAHEEFARREAERAEAERAAQEQVEAERRAAEQAAAERAEAERLEAERLAAEEEAARQETKRRREERLEAHRLEEERLAAEQHEAERREAERQLDAAEAERQELERLAEELAELERAEAEQAERAERERREAERIAEDEAQHLERERVEQERVEQERAEQERAEQERAEQERAEQERAEQERAEQERVQQERIAAEQAERERQESERAEHERAERERAAAEAALSDESARIAPPTEPSEEVSPPEPATTDEGPAPEPATTDEGPAPEPPATEPPATEPPATEPPAPEPGVEAADELDLAIGEWQAAKAAGERRRARAANERVVELLRAKSEEDPRTYGPQLIDALEQLSSIRLRTGDIFGARAPSREAKALAKSLGL